MTQPELQEHLHALEERLLHPDRETDRNRLSSLLSEDFKEFCTSDASSTSTSCSMRC